jgi:hypothetical protein
LRRLYDLKSIEEPVLKYMRYNRRLQHELDQDAARIITAHCQSNPFNGSFGFMPSAPTSSHDAKPWIKNPQVATRVLTQMIRWSSGAMTPAIKPAIMSRLIQHISDTVDGLPVKQEPFSVARVQICPPTVKTKTDSRNNLSDAWFVNRNPLPSGTNPVVLKPVVSSTLPQTSQAHMFRLLEQSPPFDSQLWDGRWWLRLVTNDDKVVQDVTFQARPFNVRDLERLRHFAAVHRLAWLRHNPEFIRPNEMGLTLDAWQRIYNHTTFIPVDYRYTIPVVTARSGSNSVEQFVAFPTLGVQLWRDKGVVCESVYAEPVPGQSKSRQWAWSVIPE